MTTAPERRPLDAGRLDDALLRAGGRWGEVTVVATTGSTNADAAAAALVGAVEGWAVLADEQVAGRGRLQRSWSSPPGGSLSLSVVLTPKAPATRWGWLPLLVGTAVVDALSEHCPAALKWPNDVVVDGPARDGGPGPRKLGGILLERVPASVPTVVVGMGVNVDLAAEELPTPEATSLLLEAAPGGALPQREVLAAAMLSCLRARYQDWRTADGDPVAAGLRAAYEGRCSTLGQRVRVLLPGGGEPTGEAVAIDDEGRLLVDHDGRVVPYAAGDIRHVRR